MFSDRELTRESKVWVSFLSFRAMLDKKMETIIQVQCERDPTIKAKARKETVVAPLAGKEETKDEVGDQIEKAPLAEDHDTEDEEDEDYVPEAEPEDMFGSSSGDEEEDVDDDKENVSENV